MQRLDIEFIQQFKEEGGNLPVIDHANGDLILRCFTNKKKERRFLRKLLENELGHTYIISELIVKLENEDMAIARRLIRYMEGLLDTFSADIRKEPYSATYYKSLRMDIRNFLDFIASGENPHVALYNQLNSLLPGEIPSAPVCSRNIRCLMTALKESAGIMCTYHDVFTNLMQQESEKMGKLLVTSRIGQRLFKLSLVMESLIHATRCTYTRIEEWQKQVKRMQRQEVYN